MKNFASALAADVPKAVVYAEYLKSDAWKAKRAAVLDRAHGLCDGCRVRSATQVHHLTYDHVGDELLFELVAVCDACHDKVHGKRSKKRAPSPSTLREARSEMGPRGREALEAIEKALAENKPGAPPPKRPDFKPNGGPK